VALFRDLQRQSPTAFGQGFAIALHNLGAWLDAAGEREQALAATSDAIEAYAKLPEPSAEMRMVHAQALMNQARWLLVLKRSSESADAAGAAAMMYSDLATSAETPPAGVREKWAEALYALGEAYEQGDRHAEAAGCWKDAVEQLGLAVATARDRAVRARMHHNLAAWLEQMKSSDALPQALIAAEQAEREYECLLSPSTKSQGDYANLLSHHGQWLRRLGRDAEASFKMEAAVSRFADLARQDPDAFRIQRAMALHQLAEDLVRRGDHAAARKRWIEAALALRPVVDGPVTPARPMHANNLAWFEFMSEDLQLLEAADGHSRDALESLPDAPYAHGTRGAVLVALGSNLEEAEEHLLRAFRENPLDALRALNVCCLAILYARRGNTAEANRWLQQACAMDGTCVLLARASEAIASSSLADKRPLL
jgi:tetratricopeptide (TPR) repeat protein